MVTILGSHPAPAQPEPEGAPPEVFTESTLVEPELLAEPVPQIEFTRTVEIVESELIVEPEYTGRVLWASTGEPTTYDRMIAAIKRVFA